MVLVFDCFGDKIAWAALNPAKKTLIGLGVFTYDRIERFSQPLRDIESVVLQYKPLKIITQALIYTEDLPYLIDSAQLQALTISKCGELNQDVEILQKGVWLDKLQSRTGWNFSRSERAMAGFSRLITDDSCLSPESELIACMAFALGS
jgi:hypothetical protein